MEKPRQQDLPMAEAIRRGTEIPSPLQEPANGQLRLEELPNRQDERVSEADARAVGGVVIEQQFPGASER